jgi:hypothetical protein
MARRNADAEAKHGAVVEHLADTLDERWDWVFPVDVSTEHGSPSEIDGHLTDVTAQSGDRELVVDVEIDPAEDADQRQPFTNWASSDPNRTYDGVVATDYDDWEEFESEGMAALDE